MARPIKETPILFGDDARRFEERMNQKRTVSQEETDRVKRHYDIVMQWFENRSLCQTPLKEELGTRITRMEYYD